MKYNIYVIIISVIIQYVYIFKYICYIFDNCHRSVISTKKFSSHLPINVQQRSYLNIYVDVVTYKYKIYIKVRHKKTMIII